MYQSLIQQVIWKFNGKSSDVVFYYYEFSMGRSFVVLVEGFDWWCFIIFLGVEGLMFKCSLVVKFLFSLLLVLDCCVVLGENICSVYFQLIS